MGKSLIIKGANFSINGIVSEYTRLAWLGCSTRNSLDSGVTNGEYISSGVNMTEETRLVVEAIMDDSTHDVQLCGSRTSVPTQCQAWAKTNVVTFYFARKDASTAMSMDVSTNIWDGKKHVFDISKGGIVLDGVPYYWSSTPYVTEGQTSPLYLDCSSASSAGNYNSAAVSTSGGTRTPLNGVVKYVNIKIYSDYQDLTSLVVDAIPVKRKSDNVVCFYNTVNGEYLVRNNGSTPDYGTL